MIQQAFPLVSGQVSDQLTQSSKVGEVTHSQQRDSDPANFVRMLNFIQLSHQQ